MLYKEDWPEAERRLTALWHHERLDRPCIAVRAPLPTVDDDIAETQPADDEARYLDPAFVVPRALRRLKSTWWGGEALPGTLMLAGWVNCLGGTPHFAADTIWFDIVPVDFSQPSPFRHDPDSPWTKKYLLLLDAMLQAAGRDNFSVMVSAGLPANDIISMLMGTEEFLFAMLDHPQWMADAIATGARDRMELLDSLRQFRRAKGHTLENCKTGWLPFWAPEPFSSTQSDVSCMLSPAMFDRFVVPELEITAQKSGSLWFHLDGGNARQHLPRLLSLPFIKVIQYTPTLQEPQNGPGHLDMYREIQQAGKILHIEVPQKNVEPLVRELDPARLMLETQCQSRSDGQRLLEQMVSWTR